MLKANSNNNSKTGMVKRVGVVGQIGIGKSTFVENRPAGWIGLPELVPLELLGHQIQDPGSAAHFQTTMLTLAGGRHLASAEIANSLKSLPSFKGVVVERPLRENLIFEQAQRKLAIDGGIGKNYEVYYEMMLRFYVDTPSFSDLDVYIVLWSGIDTLMKRINKRGRGEEKTIERRYIAILQKLYFVWTLINYESGLVLAVDWEKKLKDETKLKLAVSECLDAAEQHQKPRSSLGRVKVCLSSIEGMDDLAVEAEMARVMPTLFSGGVIEFQGGMPECFRLFSQY